MTRQELEDLGFKVRKIEISESWSYFQITYLDKFDLQTFKEESFLDTLSLKSLISNLYCSLAKDLNHTKEKLREALD